MEGWSLRVKAPAQPNSTQPNFQKQKTHF